jgi:hypothetical protein
MIDKKPFWCRLGFHSRCWDTFNGDFCNFCFKKLPR